MNAQERASAFFNDYDMVCARHGISIGLLQSGFVLFEYSPDLQTHVASAFSEDLVVKSEPVVSVSNTIEGLKECVSLRDKQLSQLHKDLSAAHVANDELVQKNKDLEAEVEATAQQLAGPDL